jgi:hypothetical protein
MSRHVRTRRRVGRERERGGRGLPIGVIKHCIRADAFLDDVVWRIFKD